MALTLDHLAQAIYGRPSFNAAEPWQQSTIIRLSGTPSMPTLNPSVLNYTPGQGVPGPSQLMASTQQPRLPPMRRPLTPVAPTLGGQPPSTGMPVQGQAGTFGPPLGPQLTPEQEARRDVTARQMFQGRPYTELSPPEQAEVDRVFPGIWNIEQQLQQRRMQELMPPPTRTPGPPAGSVPWPLGFSEEILGPPSPAHEVLGPPSPPPQIPGFGEMRPQAIRPGEAMGPTAVTGRPQITAADTARIDALDTMAKHLFGVSYYATHPTGESILTPEQGQLVRVMVGLSGHVPTPQVPKEGEVQIGGFPTYPPPKLSEPDFQAMLAARLQGLQRAAAPSPAGPAEFPTGKGTSPMLQALLAAQAAPPAPGPETPLAPLPAGTAMDYIRRGTLPAWGSVPFTTLGGPYTALARPEPGVDPLGGPPGSTARFMELGQRNRAAMEPPVVPGLEDYLAWQRSPVPWETNWPEVAPGGMISYVPTPTPVPTPAWPPGFRRAGAMGAPAVAQPPPVVPPVEPPASPGEPQITGLPTTGMGPLFPPPSPSWETGDWTAFTPDTGAPVGGISHGPGTPVGLTQSSPVAGLTAQQTFTVPPDTGPPALPILGSIPPAPMVTPPGDTVTAAPPEPPPGTPPPPPPSPAPPSMRHTTTIYEEPGGAARPVPVLSPMLEFASLISRGPQGNPVLNMMLAVNKQRQEDAYREEQAALLRQHRMIEEARLKHDIEESRRKEKREAASDEERNIENLAKMGLDLTKSLNETARRRGFEILQKTKRLPADEDPALLAADPDLGFGNTDVGRVARDKFVAATEAGTPISRADAITRAHRELRQQTNVDQLAAGLREVNPKLSEAESILQAERMLAGARLNPTPSLAERLAQLPPQEKEEILRIQKEIAEAGATKIQMPRPLPTEILREAIALKTTAQELAAAAELFDPSFVGTWANVKQWFGKAADIAGIPVFKERRAFIDRWINAIFKLKAIIMQSTRTTAEMKDFARAVPDPSESTSLTEFASAAAALIDRTITELHTMPDLLVQSGYTDIGFADEIVALDRARQKIAPLAPSQLIAREEWDELIRMGRTPAQIRREGFRVGPSARPGL